MADKLSRDTAGGASPSPTARGGQELAKPSYWAVLPAAIRYDPEIPAFAKLLYAEISALTEAKGYCFAANDYFVQLYGMAERTLQRHLRSLEKAGYIRIQDGQGGKTVRKIYAGVNPLAAYPDKNDGVTPTKMSPSPDKNVTPTINNKKLSRKENDPPKAPQGAGADYEPKKAPDWKPERWEKFWAFYPLHKSKQAAIKAWDRLKPSDELLAVIGKALVRQIAEKQAECARLRIPFEWKIYASSYLNGARWTDEEDEVDEIDGPPRASAPAGERRDLLWI